MPRLSRTFFLLVSIVMAAIFLRFFNLSDRLYFIYDQGRDAYKLLEIISGNLTLVGPTSGLAGFFLGPLWYYAGVPGLVLGQGSPYLLASWYILLGLTAVPAFWLISKKLFPSPWNLVAFALLCLLPGAVRWGIFIWNPLISIPLMAYGFLAFLHARQSRLALGLGFLCLAFTLQSEFAYAIFFIAPLLVLIPWIRQKFAWQDFMVSGIAIAVTLVPQFVFELKNNFLLSRSLIEGVTSGEGSVGFVQLWQTRPFELYYFSSTFFLGFPFKGEWWALLILATLLIGTFFIVRKWPLSQLKNPSNQLYNQALLLLFFLLPYLGFLVWAGNEGNFFDYYLTPHFIFCTLLFVLVSQTLWQKKLGKVLVASSFALLLFFSAKYYHDFIFFPVNNAGLKAIDTAVLQLYEWQRISGEERPSMLVFTPAYQNEQYDYVIRWRAQKFDLQQPPAIRQVDNKNWFLLMEKNSSDISKFRFAEWYPMATEGGKLKERKQLGVLELEWWEAQ